MRSEEQITAIEGEFRAAFARMTWRDLPTARVRYDTTDDCLVVDLVENDPLDEVVVHERLLVQFDGSDSDAQPVSVVLTRPWAEPESPATKVAREVLGEHLWASAEALAAGAEEEIDVTLDADVAADCRKRWDQLASQLRDPVWVHTVVSDTDWVVGVEFVPSRVHLVLTDAEATVFDEEITDLDGNEPQDVVDAIVTSADRIAVRHPTVAVAACPIGVQLGGPVDTANGIVEVYDKPVSKTDRPWQGVRLADLIREETGRDVLVFNDAWAFATHEAEFGLGRHLTKVVVLVVRQGVGAKLLHDGRVVDDFPMEIGMYKPAPKRPQRRAAKGVRRSIEARSSVKAIVARVRKTGVSCTTIQEAAEAAEHSAAARAVFEEAGRSLAPGMAALQALINPDAWVVVGPAAVVDREYRSAAAFLDALDDVDAHVGWSGLLPGLVVPRSTAGPLGAQAAALAALRSERIKPTFHRNSVDG